MNIPNQVTFSRLFTLPFLIYLLDNPTDNQRWWALIIFLIASFTDWLDGYLARKLDQITELGKFLDPLVDKLLVLAPLLSLLQLGQIPAWAVFLIFAREITIAGWRVNPNLSSKTITGANLWGKLKTVMQILAIALLITPLPSNLQILGIITFYLAVFLTLISGLIYLTENNQPEIIAKN